MDELFLNVNWLAVVVGAVIAFAIGWLWYSDALFGKKWRQGSGTPAVANRSMLMPMVAQAAGTFLLAWVIGITAVTDSLAFAILIVLTISGLIKANGFFAGKSMYAIAVEAGYIVVMAVVMVLAHVVL